MRVKICIGPYLQLVSFDETASGEYLTQRQGLFRYHCWMHYNQNELYNNLYEYIFGILGDNISSLKIINVLIRAEVPLPTFVTAVKLYSIIQNRLNNTEVKPRQSLFSKLTQGRRSKITRENMKVLEDKYLLLLVCSIISSKYYRDIAFTNESWEGISDMDKRMLNEAEKTALLALDYHVSSQGDGVVLKAITGSLRKAGILIPEQENTSRGKFKGIIKKVLCFG